MLDLSQNRKPEISVWKRKLSANGSIIRLNIVGDKGQPCLVPLDIKKDLEASCIYLGEG